MISAKVAHMKQLGEFVIGDFARLVFAKVQLDEVAVEVEWHLGVEGGVRDDVLKLVWKESTGHSMEILLLNNNSKA